MRPLLVLDLDETLVYASETPLPRSGDFRLGPYHVYRRPGVVDFLCSVSGHYDLAVWTSSSPGYARGIVDAIFAGRSLRFVRASDRCTPTRDFENDSWVNAKRLSKLKRRGFDLERVLMIDDSPEKHTRNYGNLIRVLPFEGDLADDELPRLATYLLQIAGQASFRTIEKRHWRQSVADWRSP
jgi:RNA polymerase II subunit A small phosphatase-like protein